MFKIKDTGKRDAVYASLSAPTREIKNRITFGHYEVNPQKSKVHFFIPEKTVETVSIRITQDGNGNTDGIAIGNACVSSFSCELKNKSPGYIYSDKIAFIESGIKLKDSSVFYMPMGFFNCLKAKTKDDGNTFDIEGYDDIYNMSKPWKSGIELTEETSFYDILKDLADRYALELTFQSAEIKTLLMSYKLTVRNKLAGYKDRDILGFIAGSAGCNARMTTEGKLYIGWFENSDYIIEPTVQWQEGFLKTDDMPFEVDSITSGIDENVFTEGTGKGIEFPNPLMDAEKVHNVYERIVTHKRASWQPSSCTWRGNPCIEAGDIVTVKDRKGASHKVYIAAQEIELAGGLVASIDCQSNSDKISFSTFENNPDIAIKQVYSDMQQAIADAADKINGATGGYYKVLFENERPYGWQCMAPNGLEGVKCTYGGIGCTVDGGKTYKHAVVGKGFVGDLLTIGRINGGNGKYFLDLETGDTSFSAINITGGDIDMDGGTIRTHLWYNGIDISPGFISLMFDAGGHWSDWNQTYNGFQLKMTGLGAWPSDHPERFGPQGGWFATFATDLANNPPETEARKRGFRFATNLENIYVNQDIINENDVIWENSLAFFENNAIRFRENLYINEKLSDKFSGIVCYRNHDFQDSSNPLRGKWDVRFGTGVAASSECASLEVNDYELWNSSDIKSNLARFNLYSPTPGESVAFNMATNGVTKGALKFEGGKLWFYDTTTWREVWLK